MDAPVAAPDPGPVPLAEAVPLILAKLSALEAAVARLAAPAPVPAPGAAVPAGAKRLTTRQALAALGVSRTTLEGYAARGLCRQVRPSGRKGPNSRVYYLPDEVEALARGEDFARDLMARKYGAGKRR